MFEICVGSKETMQMIAEKGFRALNPKTMRWQLVDKDVIYQIRTDKTIPDEESKTGFTDCATLLCNKDLCQIAKDKGLIR